MATVGSLNISFNTDVAQLQNDMRKASKTVGKNSQKMRVELKQTRQTFSKLAKGTAAATAAVAGFGFTVKKSLNQATRIKRLSNTAGVGIEKFQEFSFAFRQVGSDAETAAEALKEIQNRVGDLLVADSGPIKDVLESAGISKAQLRAAQDDAEELFLIAARGFQRLESQTQRTFFLEEFFGGQAGERMRELFSQGEQGIKDMLKQSQKLGQVMSEDAIDSADRLNDSIGNLQTTMTKAFATGAIEKLSGQFNNFSEAAKSEELKTAMKDLGSLAAGFYKPLLN
jgi:hypothetical protein